MTLNEIQAEERALTDFQFAIIDAMNERGVFRTHIQRFERATNQLKSRIRLRREQLTHMGEPQP
ncbi:hypothetical protein [Mesorhizobium sp. BHbdii]